MIVFLGSPLWDIISQVDVKFLKKFELEADDTVRSNAELEKIFIEILKFEPLQQIGGSVCNSARVLHWIAGNSMKVTLIGCVGADRIGQNVKNCLREEEICCELFEIPQVGTGKVAVLLTDDKRSMVSHLGASEMFCEEHLTEKLWKIIEDCQYFYVSAFSLGACYPALKKIIKYCRDAKKTVILNLGAAFLCEKYPEDFTYLFENSDVIFGNEREFKAFARIHFDEVMQTHEVLLKFDNKRRLLVMTRGSDSVFVFCQNELKEYETRPVHKDNIVDTNGAGDAFVGGFLAQYLKNRSIEECVECGMWAAKEIVQRHGCNFDKNKLFRI